MFSVALALTMLFADTTAFGSVDTAGSVCVINTVTGEVVSEKDADDKRSMASTTKIMTLICALENADTDEIVTVCDKAPYTEGSSAYLKPGAKITMYDLLCGLMLNSGNDAAVAIAHHISGDTEKFAELMTQTAKRIGVHNSQFKNPNGLEDDGHYTTAYDLAKITRYGMKNSTFCEIVSKRSHTAEMTLKDGTAQKVEYINHNRLLRELDGCVGVKTGFTKAAGRCLVSATEREGGGYIAVTLSDSDDWHTHKDLHNGAFDSARQKQIINEGECIKHAVSGKTEVSLVAKDGFSLFTNRERFDGVEVIVNLPQRIDFPLNEGEKVGELQIISGGEKVGCVDIVAESDFVPQTQAKLENCYLFTVITILRNIL